MQMTQALYFHLEEMMEKGERFPPARCLTDHIDEINTTAGDFFTFIPINMNKLKRVQNNFYNVASNLTGF